MNRVLAMMLLTTAVFYALGVTLMQWHTRDVVSAEPRSFSRVVRAICKRGEYCANGALCERRLAEIRSASVAAGLTERQALSMRKLLLTERACMATGRVRTQPHRALELCAAYERGESLVDLARTADMPPIALFRVVLRERHASDLSVKQFKRFVQHALRQPAQVLPERDQLELARAFPVDCAAFTSEDDLYGQRRGAYRLERALQHHLTEHGVRFVTEDEQRVAHEASGAPGPLLSTPDILASRPVRINGRRVHWLDAKAYFGPAAFTRQGKQTFRMWLKKTREQAKRYDERFGPGAMVFALGYCTQLASLLPQTLLLDAAPVGGADVLDRPADVVVVQRPVQRARRRAPPRKGAPTRESTAATGASAAASTESPRPSATSARAHLPNHVHVPAVTLSHSRRAANAKTSTVPDIPPTDHADPRRAGAAERAQRSDLRVGGTRDDDSYDVVDDDAAGRRAAGADDGHASGSSQASDIDYRHQ